MRKNRRLQVRLEGRDQRELAGMLRRGKYPVRMIKRAQALRLLGGGESAPRVGQAVGLSAEAERKIGWRYVEQGLEGVLAEPPRKGRPRRLSPAQAQRVIAMVCARPPEGRAGWTVRLVAEEVPKRGLGPPLARETARLLLRRHHLKPWREKNVVYPSDR